MLKHENLTKLKCFHKLKNLLPQDLRTTLNATRIQKYDIKIDNQEVHYNYSAKQINEKHIEIFQRLSEEAQLIEKYKSLVKGDLINISENRKVLHHLTRGQLGSDIIYDEENMKVFFTNELEKIYKFAEKIHCGIIKSANGKQFKNIVQIGIGGSSLGPKALYYAIKNYAKKNGLHAMNAYFISNIDPDDGTQVLDSIHLQETLFIVVSKSGTTQETSANTQLVIKKLEEQGIKDYKKQILSITTKRNPLIKENDYLEHFHMHDSIGGRFSSTSAVGITLLTLAFTKKITKEILRGAHACDKHALNPNIEENSSLTAALIGVYERNVLAYPTNCIVAYSKALEYFYLHLQQLEMESNGKRVNRFGEVIDYKTARITWGGIGTDVQHSFFQLLHQGTDIVPIDFIGFSETQLKEDVFCTKSSNNEKLKANLIAQIIAFAQGKENKDNNNKTFNGNIPSALIYSKQLTPYVLGTILAHYENKVMFEGFLWNINSFDQEGVQLGKTITSEILNSNILKNEVIITYERLLNK